MLTKLYCRVVSRLKSEEGATAVEYGIMVSLIAVAIILVVTAMGAQLKTVFNNVVTALGGIAVP
ncbi:MAG: Flp family type IVb pilin [Actinobacteria bacterium]|nr:Flp family type IVb pilin [Actinomycetota bacterium]